MNSREMDEQDELREMLRCVQLCYEQDMSQAQAAEKLGLGKKNASRVSRLLKRAREEGYVRFDYQFPEFPKLAERLISKYELRDAVVIAGGEELHIKRDIGRALARYFERKVATDNLKIGLSCGYTLYHFVNSLQERLFKGFQIYPLSDDMTVELVDLFPDTLVGMMAAKYRPNVTAYAFHGHLLEGEKPPENEMLVRLIEQSRRVYNEAKDVEVAVLGIGSISISKEPDIPGFRQFAKLCGVPGEALEENAAGEFNYQPFDDDGVPVTAGVIKPLIDRTKAVRIEDFQKLAKSGKRVIAGVGGLSKLKATQAALRGKFFNILVTDHTVARALLK